MALPKVRQKKSSHFLESDQGATIVLLIIKGHSLDARPMSQMTRKQRLAYTIAYKIESDEQRKAQKRATRKAKSRRGR